MPDGSELEIKLAISDNRLFDLIKSDPEITALAQGVRPVDRVFEALYYDTPQFSLQQNGLAFRVRHEDEDWVATVKSDLRTGGGLFEREEWNENVSGPEPSRTPFEGTNVGDRLAKVIGLEKLQLLFSTRFVRTVIQLQTDSGTQIEMALDRGTIWSGIDGTPISELELELKSGSVNELLQLAAKISARWHLLPEIKSKFARGLELLQPTSPNLPDSLQKKVLPENAEPTPIALVNSCIADLFIFQDRILRNNAIPENIRGLRIQCRRLRSILKFCQPALSKDTVQPHIDHLRQWGGVLGSIRDIDVLINSWEKFAIHFSPVYSPSGHWQDILRERRDFLTDDVLFRIRQGELTQLLFELQGLAYQEQERQSPVEEELSFGLIAHKTFIRTIKELRDDIRAVDGITDIKALHQFRIRCKQLRYIQEALNGYSRYRDEEFAAEIKKIQSHIGKIHDTYQIKSIFDQFDACSIDENFSLEKELFISWRNRDTIEYFFALPKAVDAFRRSAKLRLRTLAAMRTNRRTKSGQNTGPHEPIK